MLPLHVVPTYVKQKVKFETKLEQSAMTHLQVLKTLATCINGWNHLILHYICFLYPHHLHLHQVTNGDSH